MEMYTLLVILKPGATLLEIMAPISPSWVAKPFVNSPTIDASLTEHTHVEPRILGSILPGTGQVPDLRRHQLRKETSSLLLQIHF
jgi:hypothetical protein